MGSIELRERAFGGGLVGHVQVAPSLSWIDSQALRSTAFAATATVRSLEQLGYSVQQVVGAVFALEARIGLALDTQTAVLAEQSAALERIEVALRNPAKVRAAERVADAAKLLEVGRFDRALVLAQEAIEGDPVGSGGPLAAGWALLGLDRLAEAKEMFAEAALFSGGDASSQATRQQARLAFALDDSEGAVGSLERIQRAEVSADEWAAVTYDCGLYRLGLDEHQALDDFAAAFEHDVSYCFMALADPVLDSNENVRRLAIQRLAEVDSLAEQTRLTLLASLESARERIKLIGSWGPGDRSHATTVAAASGELGAITEALDGLAGSVSERQRAMAGLSKRLASVETELRAVAAGDREARRVELTADLEELLNMRATILTNPVAFGQQGHAVEAINARIDSLGAALAQLEAETD